MDEKMGFGKYAELSFEQVRTQHPDYLEWARKQREEKGVYGRLQRWVEYCAARAGAPSDAAASAEGASVSAVPFEAVPCFAVALVSREAAIQLEWGLSQRAAAWSSTPVPACMQGAPPPEGAETVLREHGARLGLDEATTAEYVRTGSADPAGTLSAMISRVVTSISLEDLGLGLPLVPDKVPWLVGRLIGFLGSHLAQTAQMAHAAWAADSDSGERSADGVSFGHAVEFVPSTRMRGSGRDGCSSTAGAASATTGRPQPPRPPYRLPPPPRRRRPRRRRRPSRPRVRCARSPPNG